MYKELCVIKRNDDKWLDGDDSVDKAKAGYEKHNKITKLTAAFVIIVIVVVVVVVLVVVITFIIRKFLA